MQNMLRQFPVQGVLIGLFLLYEVHQSHLDLFDTLVLLVLIAITLNFQQRQQAQADLQEQKDLLKLALECAKMGAWDWNVLTNEEQWSKEVEELFGVTTTESHLTYRYEKILEKVHPDDKEAVIAARQLTLSTGRPYNIEYRIITDDGKIRWLNSFGNVIRDSNNSPIRLTGVVMDITQRKQTEAVLQETEARYRSIFENAADGIFQTTPQGQYMSANPALATIYGYDCPQTLMKVLSNQIDQRLYVLPNRRAEFMQLMAEHQSVSDFESQVFRQDGTIIWISENARAVHDPDGNLRYYEGTVKDISDRKRIADELLQAKELAESANRAKSQFLANISHELRTPLNSIIGYSDMLQEESVSLGYGEIVPDLQKIQKAGKHLLRLINDILDMSKIEAGKMSLYLEPFDIHELIVDVYATVQPLIKKNRNTFVIHCPPAIGIMFADLVKVRQALFNLLSNASKFTENGTITLTVEREHAQTANPGVVLAHSSGLLNSNVIVFTVTDTGIGISPDQLTRLFQPFMQADNSTTRKYGGTGLGLSITQRVCQMMGGEVSVQSQLGSGSTFTIRLPEVVKEPELDCLTE